MKKTKKDAQREMRNDRLLINITTKSSPKKKINDNKPRTINTKKMESSKKRNGSIMGDPKIDINSDIKS